MLAAIPRMGSVGSREAALLRARAGGRPGGGPRADGRAHARSAGRHLLGGTGPAPPPRPRFRTVPRVAARRTPRPAARPSVPTDPVRRPSHRTMVADANPGAATP